MHTGTLIEKFLDEDCGIVYMKVLKITLELMNQDQTLLEIKCINGKYFH